MVRRKTRQHNRAMLLYTPVPDPSRTAHRQYTPQFQMCNKRADTTHTRVALCFWFPVHAHWLNDVMFSNPSQNSDKYIPAFVEFSFLVNIAYPPSPCQTASYSGMQKGFLLNLANSSIIPHKLLLYFGKGSKGIQDHRSMAFEFQSTWERDVCILNHTYTVRCRFLNSPRSNPQIMLPLFESFRKKKSLPHHSLSQWFPENTKFWG